MQSLTRGWASGTGRSVWRSSSIQVCNASYVKSSDLLPLFSVSTFVGLVVDVLEDSVSGLLASSPGDSSGCTTEVTALGAVDSSLCFSRIFSSRARREAAAPSVGTSAWNVAAPVEIPGSVLVPCVLFETGSCL